MAIEINGKEFSRKVLDEIRNEHLLLQEKYGRKAGLAVIIVGEDPASQVYVRNKVRECENVGFYSETMRLPSETTQENLIEKIEGLNRNSQIDGILVQLPLPRHINELEVINAISPEKDVDGFHVVNIGKMVIGDDTGFLSCTPYGIMQLLEEYGIDTKGKDAVIIGRSNIVGKPMALMLIQKGATVQVCNSKTKGMSEKLKAADIIIAAAGVPGLVKGEDVKEGAVIIDVGINRVDGRLCGDVDYEEARKNASYITPVPGGVGPMTIASLIRNTFSSYKVREAGRLDRKN